MDKTHQKIAPEKQVVGKSVTMDNKGVDGDVSTFFHTNDKDKESWYAVDFGSERRRVTRVRIVNKSATTAKGQ